jgi:hypothetical protein
VSAFPPRATAAIDQELADLDERVGFMVAAFRRAAAERGDAQTLADLAVTANATFEPELRGELLAAAVRRLARAEQP